MERISRQVIFKVTINNNMEIIGVQIDFETPLYKKDGKFYIKDDVIEIEKEEEIELILESSGDTVEQYVALKTDKDIVNSEGDKAKSWAFWWSKNNEPIVLTVKSKKKKLEIWNGWKDEHGLPLSGTGGSGMRIEDLKDGSRRYHCNNATMNNDFDDLVFRIKRKNGKPVWSYVLENGFYENKK